MCLKGKKILFLPNDNYLYGLIGQDRVFQSIHFLEEGKPGEVDEHKHELIQPRG